MGYRPETILSLFGWAIEMQADLMNLYTVGRMLRPYVRHGVLIAGDKHIGPILAMLEKCGMRKGDANTGRKVPCPADKSVEEGNAYGWELPEPPSGED